MENRMKMTAVGILMVCLLPLAALAQQQDWQSTSTMRGSGSAYSSQVTTVGATSVGSMATTTASAPSRPRRTESGSGSSSDPWSGGNETTEAKDEGSPLGDALIPLMLCACAYLIVRVFLKRKRALKGE